ncbi:MAG: hypothetical protein P8169_10030, partial [Chloroflexota bacterium]
VGDPEDMGKPVGNDLLQGRGVLAVKNGLGTAVAEADVAVQEKPDAIEKMMANLRDSGALEIARLQAVESGQRARKALERLEPSAAKDELDDLIDVVLNRQR